MESEISNSQTKSHSENRPNNIGESIKEIIIENKELYEKTINRQLKTITIVFSIITTFFAIIAAVVGYLSISSQTKVDEAIRDLQTQRNELQDKVYSLERDLRDRSDSRWENIENKVESFSTNANNELKSTINEIEDKFDKLAGESLKKPVIDIMLKGLPLDNQVVELKVNKGDQIQLPQFTFKNSGDKELQVPSINFFVSEEIKSITMNPRESIENYLKTSSPGNLNSRKTTGIPDIFIHLMLIN